MEVQVQQLLAEVDELKSTLNVKQEQLELSARIGKKLLEDNSELAAKYEAAVEQSSAQLEVLQQENFHLRTTLTHHTASNVFQYNI